MFDITNFTLASAVADNGTVTVGYATGRSQGSYDWTTGKHVLYVAGNKYSAPADFTLTFNANASSITLTNKSGVSWPISSDCRLQIESLGVTDLAKLHQQADTRRIRQVPGGLFMLNLGSPNVADADGYCASQDLTSAGVFSSSVTAAAAIAAAALAGTADVPRNVVAAWTGTAVLTITGTDEYGVVIRESSASGTSLTGKKAFKTVTGISSSANITSLTVGTGDVLGLPVAVPKAGQIIAEFKDGVRLAGFRDAINLPFFFNQTDLLAPTAANLVAPVAGYITGIRTIVQAAVTTGGAITVEANTVAVVGLSVTVADAAAAGTTHSDTVERIATGLVAAGDDLTVTPAAAFATAGAVNGHLVLEPLNVLNGTFVAAVGTEATATTGDVRGTYDPATTADGDAGFMLLVALFDPTDKGITQY